MVVRPSLVPEVLVGVTRMPRLGPDAAPERSLLGSAARDRAGRMRDPRPRIEHLAGRALARWMLAQEAGCDPYAIRLRRTALGRPEAVAPTAARRLRFSIAHADGLVLCAVIRDRAIGADVESLSRLGGDPLALAEVACTERERRALLRTPPQHRAEGVLAIWTMKEAVAKATGLGVRMPFESTRVDALPGGASLVRWPRAGRVQCSLWRLIRLRLTHRHLAAIAVQVPDEDVLAIAGEA